MRLACLLLAVSVSLEGQSPHALLEQAQRLFDQKRYPEALKTLTDCLAADPRNAAAYKLVALSAIPINRLDIAEPALKSALELTPDDYLVHFNLGALYFTKSDFLRAKPNLERTVALNPEYMPAHVFLGLTEEELGSNDAAISSYRKAIALTSSQAAGQDAPYLRLGKLLYRLDRFDESLPLLSKAVEMNPNSGEALLAMGKTLHALHRDKEAVAVLQRCTTVGPDNADAHYTLYRIFTMRSQTAAAAAELERFRAAKIFTPHGERALVLVFIRTDCPTSNRYAPEIQRLYARFSPKKLEFHLVYPQPGITPAAMDRHRREYHYDIPGTIDSRRTLVTRARATVTPEAAVFVHGRLVYLGRIDDGLPDIGKARAEVEGHDLETVLEAIAAGQQVAFRETKAIGCAIGKIE
jgi:tetratricopeptide (TPR) repeat protein